ncbi:MAG: tripartite tricarboxylate transporter TctB family protein [Hyphomicrobiales bacterium]
MKIRNQKDFWSAVMFIIFGVLFMIWSTDYQFGTAQRMGPGYFPTVLGGMLVALGLLVGWPAVKANAEETKVEKIGWRGLIVILAAVVLYGVLLPHLGFIIALAVLLLLSSMASPEFTWKATLLSIVVLGICSYVTFVKGLDLQFPVWPPFLTR